MSSICIINILRIWRLALLKLVPCCLLMPWAIQGPSALRSPFAFEKTRQLLYRLTMFNFYFLSYVFSEERGRGWKWIRCNLWTISCCIKHLRVCVNRLQFMDYILLYGTFTCECVQQLYRLTIFSFYFSYLLCRRPPPGGREIIERDKETEREREREKVNRLQFMDYIWLYYTSVHVCALGCQMTKLTI